MILVDTSVWIHMLRGASRDKLTPDDMLRLVTCGPVVQEVFQGLRDDSWSDLFREHFLAIPCLSDPVPLAIYEEAAEIYRTGRKRGLTIRSSTDCLIAAIAIRDKVPVWHRDRDFHSIAKFTYLRAIDKRLPWSTN